MRTPNISSAEYSPAIVPSEPKDLPRFLFDELAKISNALNLVAQGHLDKVVAAPTKPREGDIRFADGVHWNPGGGIGVYAYYSGGWHLLG